MKLLIVAVALTLSSSAFAAGARGEIACKTLFATLRVNVTPEQRVTIAKFADLNATGRLDSVVPRKNLVELLQDEDLPLFGQRLSKVIDALYANPAPASKESFLISLRKLLKSEGLPSKLIEKGIREYAVGTAESLRRLMGNLSLEETRAMFMGKTGGGTAFTADSLIGKYVKETGAAVRVMDVPDKTGARVYDEQKLFVAVSEDSFPVFAKLFGLRNFMSSLGHGAILQGMDVTDVWGRTSPLRAMRENTPLPMLILKTSEAERLHRYLRAANLPQYANWNNALKQPWRLTTAAGEKYVQQGAYQCCTNFNGNIPIGDKLVDAYALPLRMEYGNAAHVHAEVQYSKLVKWTNANEEPLKNIWTVPGHQQLSDVLGLLEANVNGEFASPGYVIQSLMGLANTSRVPVIFIFRTNHKEEIPDKPVLHFEQPV